jgi:FKBP-type peptidyl-prolyl cis-trans isomerase
MFRRILDIFTGKKPQTMDVPAFSLPDDAACTTTSSGLKHSMVQQGSGKAPGPTDKVTVHYAGWLTDGTPFDSSYSRGQTISFPLNGVIAGWTEGLQLMKEGGTSVFVIPADLGYGASGAPPVIGPHATLVFQVELVSVG